MTIRTVVLAAAAALISITTPALACSQTGVWKGTWKKGSYSGPVEMTVNNRLGFHYVSIKESNQRGQVYPAKTHRYTTRDSAVQVAGYTLNQSGCRLTGTQQHPQAGEVTVTLQRTGNAPHHRTPAFQSGNQAQQFVSGKTFAGRWNWGSLSGVRQVTFGQSNGRLTAQVTEGGKRSRAVYVTLSRDWLTYTYSLSSKTITAYMLVTKTGDLTEVRLRNDMILFAEMRATR